MRRRRTGKTEDCCFLSRSYFEIGFQSVCNKGNCFYRIPWLHTHTYIDAHESFLCHQLMSIRSGTNYLNDLENLSTERVIQLHNFCSFSTFISLSLPLLTACASTVCPPRQYYFVTLCPRRQKTDPPLSFSTHNSPT